MSCNWPASPVSSQKLKREDLTMKRQLSLGCTLRMAVFESSIGYALHSAQTVLNTRITEEGECEITIPMRSYVASGLERPPVIALASVAESQAHDPLMLQSNLCVFSDPL